MITIPKHLQKLARASRDFAEIKMLYRDGSELAKDLQAAFDLIQEQALEIDALQRRVNEIRNARDSFLADVQAVVGRFEFTMRSI